MFGHDLYTSQLKSSALLTWQGSQAPPEPDGDGFDLASFARPRKRRRAGSAECDERRAGAAGGETLLAADAAAARNRQRAESIRCALG